MREIEGNKDLQLFFEELRRICILNLLEFLRYYIKRDIMIENNIFLTGGHKRNLNMGLHTCSLIRAVKRLIMINRIQNKSLCLHNICGCTVYNCFVYTCL